MPAPIPSERQLIARVAAHQSWAATQNRTARTAAARDAFLAKFEDLVDPDHTLPPDERARRAVNARRFPVPRSLFPVLFIRWRKAVAMTGTLQGGRPRGTFIAAQRVTPKRAEP